MRPSTLGLVAQKLMDTPAFVEPLGGGMKAFVHLVDCQDPEQAAPAVILSRMQEAIENNLREAIVLVTCQSLTAADTEEIAERVVEALHEQTFNACGVKDVESRKDPADATTYDEARGLFVRELVFSVSW